MTSESNSSKIEAIACADAWLNNVGLPTYTEVAQLLATITEWGRTYTSPLDANSPMHLLIANVDALERIAATQKR